MSKRQIVLIEMFVIHFYHNCLGWKGDKRELILSRDLPNYDRVMFFSELGYKFLPNGYGWRIKEGFVIIYLLQFIIIYAAIFFFFGVLQINRECGF